MLFRLGVLLKQLAFLLILAGQATLVTSAADTSAETVWPVSNELLEQVVALEQSPVRAVAAWATTTRQLLEPLPAAAANDVSRARNSVARLAAQSQRMSALLSSVDRRQIDVSQLQRLRYSLDRRVSIWDAVLAVGPNVVAGSGKTPFTQASHGKISLGTLKREWIEYFRLDEFRRQYNALNPDPDQQKIAARNTLARMYSPVLKADQVAFVNQAISPALISMIKEAAIEPVDFNVLLKRLEQHEARPSGVTEFRLNDLYQDLVWSGQSEHQAIADRLHTHYRNANVRLSVSEELLNRLVPETPMMRERVSENVMGAKVSGQSRISNQLQVELIPDPNQVYLRLQTAGTVHSSTVARRDGFAIQNEGTARFQVFKRLAFGREGLDSSEHPVAFSTANQKVVGMRSKLDGVPVVGWMARRVASQKIREQTPRAEQMVRNKVERTVSDRLQEQVEEQLHELRTQMYQNVLQPLLALDLEPEPVQMSTTTEQLVMRYRLAGRDQMAASTARPFAMTGNLLSCQVHESALNNAIARIGLNGKKFTADQLKLHLQDLLGTPASAEAEGAGHEAEFEFAHFDPVRVRLDDGKIAISLNLKSLKIGEGSGWKRLSVTAAYEPTVAGGTIVLNQDDSGIRLKGKRLRFRDQVALRTVFEVLFDSQYRIDVLSEELIQRIGGRPGFSQLVLADGWMGLSIDDLNRQQSLVPPGRQAKEQHGLINRWNRR